MRTLVKSYLQDKNANWLERKAANTGLSKSGIINMLISQQRKIEEQIDVNLQLENARLVDLQNS